MKGTNLALVLFLTLCCSAQSPFDGDWRANLDKSEIAPDRITLANGTYHCQTCTPPYKVKADGKDQPISGSHSIDAVNVHVLDDHTVESVEKKNGKVVSTMKYHVGSDPNTMVEEWTFKTTPDSDKDYPGAANMTRVSAGPKGSHLISGVWKLDKVTKAADEGLQATYQLIGDTLKYSSPMGMSYSAKFDGKDYPETGIPGNVFVSIVRTGDRSFKETYKSEGKALYVAENSVSADGKTMTSQFKDLRNGSVSKWVMEKQVK